MRNANYWGHWTGDVESGNEKPITAAAQYLASFFAGINNLKLNYSNKKEFSESDLLKIEKEIIKIISL